MIGLPAAEFCMNSEIQGPNPTPRRALATGETLRAMTSLWTPTSTGTTPNSTFLRWQEQS